MSTAAMTATELLNSLSPDDVAEALRKAGYRASLGDTPSGPQIQSAAQGLGFFVAFGNELPSEAGRYADFSFHCWIAIEGSLPAGLIEGWNEGKRFARLFRRNQLLVLTMDVLVAGGVAPGNLQAQIEIWDRVIQDFLHHLKRPVSNGASNSASNNASHGAPEAAPASAASA